MAPMAARRAKPVQRGGCQGLRGNPDACNPGRGSARDVTATRAGGNARPVFALSVQPTAAMNPRIGGARVGGAPRPFLSHRFLWERKRCPGRAGPLREGGILYERATTGRPYGRRAESSRPTDSGGWAGIREPLIRPERSRAARRVVTFRDFTK